MAESPKYVSKMSRLFSFIRSSYIKRTATALLCNNWTSAAVTVHTGYDRSTDIRSIKKTNQSLQCNKTSKNLCVCNFILRLNNWLTTVR